MNEDRRERERVNDEFDWDVGDGNYDCSGEVTKLRGMWVVQRDSRQSSWFGLIITSSTPLILCLRTTLSLVNNF